MSVLKDIKKPVKAKRLPKTVKENKVDVFTIPKNPTVPEMVETMFDGDIDLALFFAAWLDTERNATRAMMKIRPSLGEASAAVLGHRMLRKVKKDVILEQYNLNFDRYFTKIDKGLDAKTLHNYTGEEVEDHQTQKFYHDKLGELLEVEGKAAQITVNNTQNNITVSPILSGLSHDVHSNDSDQETSQTP